MTTTSFRNISCLAGLIIGAALIASADTARAEVRDCTQEEIAQLEIEDNNLPTICEVMTVMAKRPESATDGIARIDNRDLFAAADFRAETSDTLGNQQWPLDVTS